jgi:hypothetical protein
MEKPWFQHYDEGMPTSIDYPRIPLDRLQRLGVQKGDRVAIMLPNLRRNPT